ncbi:UNVERIFIED_CONTAM: hypothetical protein Sangu_2442300 [Sesamum angustifolium]|uniref:Uncharacterized protein n=1 Tax=Sesamum angustifolium TaxID=2727405 RepID=A0AAW2KWQ3_9LAMI
MRKAPSLVDLCVQLAIDNVRYLGDVGETDFHLLDRFLSHCTLDQLTHIENSTEGRDLSPFYRTTGKGKEREEATQKSLDRIKQRYQEEDARKQSRQVQFCSKVPPPSKKRSFYGGVAASNIYNTKSGLLKKAKLEFINSVSSTRKPIVNSGFAASSSSSSSSKITKPIQRRF